MARPRLFDSACLEAIESAPDAAVAWWLMASFAYYHLDNPILSDAMFDNLTKRIIARFDELRHPHRHLITMDDLECGTGHSIRAEDYPTITKHATFRLLLDGVKSQAPAPSPAAAPAGQMSLF